jgi:hypothetical protein
MVDTKTNRAVLVEKIGDPNDMVIKTVDAL